MRLNFSKMQSLGNDFVVIDAINQEFAPTASQAKHIASRHTGIGCDQILMVASPDNPNADFKFQILNADGGSAEQCGNGARCFARFVHEKGLTDKTEIVVTTVNGLSVLSINDNDYTSVTVNMGEPEFTPQKIPFDAEISGTTHALKVGGQEIGIVPVSMGNPHAVQIVKDVDAAPVLQQGPLIGCHQRFPERANVGFMQVVDRGKIRLRVFERGVGETLACGSGACAAVAAGRKLGYLDEQVAVQLPGGELNIGWKGVGQPLFMTGPAFNVFEGVVELE